MCSLLLKGLSFNFDMILQLRKFTLPNNFVENDNTVLCFPWRDSISFFFYFFFLFLFLFIFFFLVTGIVTKSETYILFDTDTFYIITKTCPCNKQRFFELKKIENFQLKNFDIFLIFAQNIDCGYTLEPPRRGAVLTSTHNLCFEAKIRKIGIPLQTPVLLYKSGVYCTDIFFLVNVSKELTTHRLTMTLVRKVGRISGGMS